MAGRYISVSYLIYFFLFVRGLFFSPMIGSVVVVSGAMACGFVGVTLFGVDILSGLVAMFSFFLVGRG